jgi:hypothetical protein
MLDKHTAKLAPIATVVLIRSGQSWARSGLGPIRWALPIVIKAGFSLNTQNFP